MSQAAAPMSAAEVDAMIDKLMSQPDNEGIAMQIESIAEGAIASRVGEAFCMAADVADEVAGNRVGFAGLRRIEPRLVEAVGKTLQKLIGWLGPGNGGGPAQEPLEQEPAHRSQPA